MSIEWTSNTSIKALPLPERGDQVLHPDSQQDYHYVRVTKKGARAFVVDKNTKHGRIRITLGDAGTEHLTPAQSRAKARIALGLIEQGYPPAHIKAQLEQADGTVIPSNAIALQPVLDRYLFERKHKLAERTKRDYQELINTHLADWKNRPLEAINEDAVIAKFNSITSPSRANYAFRTLRTVYNYAASIRDEEGKPIVDRNPVAVLSQRRLWHDIAPKREVIGIAGLKPWWKAVKALKTEATYDNADSVRDWLIFLLLTGLRSNEAATLRWETVDLRSKLFVIAITKNREPHALPLSDYLYAMLKRRHAAMLRAKDDPKRAEYVFPGNEGALAEPQKLIAKVRQVSGVRFSPQTLRRTFASIAESLDIPYLALKRLLNHKAQDVTGKHYTVIGVERLRKPMQKVTDFILRAAGERKSADVVVVEKKRASVTPH